MRLLSVLGLFVAASVASAQSGSLIPQTTPTAHPWYVKPEAGAWMICVKSYTGELGDDGQATNTAKVFAEALAQEIRETYKVPAYLFEYGGAERRKAQDLHARELAARRAQRAEEEAQFNAVTQAAKAEAAAKGMVFMDSKTSIRAPKVTIHDQWAVLVGGWPDMATARREMEKIKTWAPPANKKLMDTQFIVHDKDSGERTGKIAFINPFQNGMVVQNPLAPKQIDAESEADTRFVMKMNAEEQYSVLKIQKNWTIAVKQFAPPHQVKGKEEKSMVARLFNPQPDAMLASYVQAQEMVKALRSTKWDPIQPNVPKVGPFESYILKTRYGSLVCVGQFDGPEDPKLLKTQQELGMIKFNVKVENGDKLKLTDSNQVRLFDHLYAMKVRD